MSVASPRAAPRALKAAAPPPPQTDVTRCSTYLPLKKRHCGGVRQPSSIHCYFHRAAEGGDGAGFTAQCSHCAVRVADVQRHERVCPVVVHAASVKNAPWNRDACNVGKPSGEERDSLHRLRSALGMNDAGLGRTRERVSPSGEAEAEGVAAAQAQRGYLDRLACLSADPSFHALVGGSDGLPTFLRTFLVPAYAAHVQASITDPPHGDCSPEGCCVAAPCRAPHARAGGCSNDPSAPASCSREGAPPCRFASDMESFIQGCAELSKLSAPSSSAEGGGATPGVLRPTSKRHLYRHGVQQASIACALHARGLLHAGATYLEFGAGKGGLSSTVDALCPGTRLVLLDRASTGGAGKADTALRRGGADFVRIKVDIADVWLQGVPGLWEARGPVVAIGKHLCGGATDLALCALATSMGAQGDPAEAASTTLASPSPATPVPPHLAGIAIATCCHHRCTWEAYVGKGWWTGVVKGTCVQFEVTRLLSGWAVCGETVGRRREGGEGAEAEVEAEVEAAAEAGVELAVEEAACEGVEGLPFPLLLPPRDLDKDGVAWLSALPRASRLTLGRMAKRLIDTGRAHFLAGAFTGYPRQMAGAGGGETSFRLRPQLVHYVPREVTVENTLLLAVAERVS